MNQTAEILKPCPCNSGVNFENCCQPHILGLEKPLTAEKLMRSRYTAFVANELDYLVATHHPETLDTLDKNGLNVWMKQSTWHGLEVVETVNGAEKDDEGIVEFIARYTQEGTTHKHHERSLFKKQDDQWYFFDIEKNLPIVNESRIGRNDPCVCGSGKKYKKCCGKI